MVVNSELLLSFVGEVVAESAHKCSLNQKEEVEMREERRRKKASHGG